MDQSKPSASASAREAEFFDTLAHEHGDFNPFHPRGWQTLRSAFEGLIRPGTPIDLIDVGCGTGQSRGIYINSVSRYVGMDLSVLGLRRARISFPQNAWV